MHRMTVPSSAIQGTWQNSWLSTEAMEPDHSTSFFNMLEQGC